VQAISSVSPSAPFQVWATGAAPVRSLNVSFIGSVRGAAGGPVRMSVTIEAAGRQAAVNAVREFYQVDPSSTFVVTSA
jgi:hypothetical protein